MPTRRDTLKLSAAALGASLAPVWAIVQGHAMPAPTPAQPGLTPDPLPRVAAFERLAFACSSTGLYSQWGKGELGQAHVQDPHDEYMRR